MSKKQPQKIRGNSIFAGQAVTDGRALVGPGYAKELCSNVFATGVQHWQYLSNDEKDRLSRTAVNEVQPNIDQLAISMKDLSDKIFATHVAAREKLLAKPPHQVASNRLTQEQFLKLHVLYHSRCPTRAATEEHAKQIVGTV